MNWHTNTLTYTRTHIHRPTVIWLMSEKYPNHLPKRVTLENGPKTQNVNIHQLRASVNCPWNSVINKIHGQMIFACGSLQFLCGDIEAERERGGRERDKHKWPAADFSSRDKNGTDSTARYAIPVQMANIIILPFPRKYDHLHTYWAIS